MGLRHVNLMALVALLVLSPLRLSFYAQARTVEVSTQPDLVDALNDPDVDRVVMLDVDWNFEDQLIPDNSILVTDNRDVLLEGEPGKYVYIDGNQLLRRASVGTNSTLRQANLHVDDCFGRHVPYTCFAQVLGGGSRLTLENFTMSDASCKSYNTSLAIETMLYSVSLGAHQPVTITQIDSRRVHVDDSGWIEYPVPDKAYWRLINVTLSCTAGITHPEPDSSAPHFIQQLSKTELISAAITLLLGLATVMVFAARRGFLLANEQFKTDYQVALRKGYTLKLLLCVSNETFGSRLYRGHHRASKEAVAIKVFTMSANDREENRAAVAECILLRTLSSHPNVVQLITSFSSMLQEKDAGSNRRNSKSKLDASPSKLVIKDVWDVDTGVDLTNEIIESLGQRTAKQALLSKSGKYLPGIQTPSNSSDSGVGDVNTTVSDSGSDLSIDKAIDEADEDGDDELSPRNAAPMLQIYFVMEFCDRGTLNQAVNGGMFKNRNGSPNVPFVLATALDIAKAIAFLHDPSRRVIHRDLNPRNVLLSFANNSRGFEAKLCDFGLSTVLPSDTSHKTAGIKGTVAYMPPEMFKEDCVSFALDIYSLGVLLFFIMTSHEPYHGKPPSKVIKRKMDVQASDFLFDDEYGGVEVPSEYRELILDCTSGDRYTRPTANQVVERLERLSCAWY